jgi:putative membrane protein
MHMTLLGALLALAPRSLYGHVHHFPWGLTQVEDQNLGGVVMLALGGAVYLLGGLVLMARLLNAAPERARTSGAE